MEVPPSSSAEQRADDGEQHGHLHADQPQELRDVVQLRDGSLFPDGDEGHLTGSPTGTVESQSGACCCYYRFDNRPPGLATEPDRVTTNRV